MIIKVTKDKVSIEQNKLNHYGEYNVNECNFEFDEHFNSVLVKRAIFTSKSTNKTIEIDIINNKCVVPSDILLETYDQVTLGVYGYDTKGEELLIRYSPEPTYFTVQEGSYREGAEQPEIITPTQYDMYSKALQEGLAEVNKRLDDVEKQGDYASEQGNYAKEQGDYAKSEGDNAKSVAEETEKKAQEGAFDGKSLEFVWEGTKLGVRLEGQEEYHFVDLQGKQGEIGATGEPFKIKKTYASVSEMNADFRNMEFGDYVMIASSVNEEDNAKLYTKGESAWIFISDFSGAMGIRGETGLTPNIKIGEVKTLEAGSQAKVTRSGSNEEPVFNFALPKGDKGDNYVLTEEDKVEIGEKVNTEYEKRIEENEKDIADLEATIDILTNTDTKKGELVHITDALPLATFENKIDGNVKQETTKGNQLLDINTVTSTDATISDGIITSKTLGNWGTITWKFPNIPLSRTIYYVSFDLRIKSGTCKHLNKLNMWESDIFVQSYDFIVNPTPSNIYQRYCIKFDLTNNTTLYNLNMINIQVADDVVDAILEVKDIMLSTSSDYTYEPFTNGASPNPDYPQEIEVVDGYNLFNKDTITENNYIDNNNIINSSQVTNLSDYISINSSTSYTLSYDYSTLLNSTHRTIVYYDKNKTYILGFNYQPTNKINTITTLSNAKYLRFAYDKNCYDIQLTKGATKKPYFPYRCVSVKNVGKNLYTFSTTDKTNNVSGVTCVYDSKNQELTINGTSTQKEVIFSTKPWGTLANKTYTITIFYVSGSITGEAMWYNQDGNSNWSGYDMPLKNETISLTKTYDVDLNFDTTSFIRANDVGVVFNNYKIKIMVEENPTATPYEPYQEQIVPLDLKGNFVGKINDNIKDYLVTDKKKYWLVKNVGKVVFTGEENITLERINDYGIANFFVPCKDMTINFICDYFVKQDSLIADTKTEGMLYTDNGPYIRIKSDFISTVDEFKQWLSENKPIVYYQLRKPQIIELGELPGPIKTFEGVNNIQLLANLDTEIEVKYALDVKKYYDNKIAEISAQII